MIKITPLASVVFLSFVTLVRAIPERDSYNASSYQDTCSCIAKAITNASAVYYPREPPGGSGYRI